MVDLAAARAAFKTAVADEEAARAALRAAGIEAKLAIDEMDGELGTIAKKHRLTPSTLSKLNPDKTTTEWAPLGLGSYRSIDAITGGRHRLAALREKLDEAKQKVKKARNELLRADARADLEETAQAARTEVAESTLVVDDVQVTREDDHVVLDIRVRNTGDRAADITRAAIRILTRAEFLTAYETTARYDLLVDGDYSEVGVAHFVKPDEVDRFTLVLGFAEPERGCVFTAELELRFNRDHVTVSKPFSLSSCFE
ncbi:hypothetical protein [Amycolatopsis sp. Hca4]|uniref:hypothetical protein n=1 Tax=Amycolatopsis sp. Hca4 TaxID=2742131 RepID=UPI0015913123|nr:hypothetical protein [Amycolatopsis sp. Hca4]QKV80644.1 hypothetical protein HUT10_47855 [Amycolatopsis sp. Hca4]